MSRPEPVLLLVDDDEVLRSRLARALRERGHTVREAADAAGAAAAAEAGDVGWAVVDLRLPDGSGLDVVRAVHAAAPAAPIVVLTGYGSIATALEAVKLGATHYLTKPASVDEVLAAFARGAAAPAPRLEAADDVPSLERVEWEHINRVLADSGGNISEAARRLGLHRRSLQRKLAKRPSRR
ncbi:MAG TPA: response regulator [Candidatus Limnocylindria bacterium]|nr:response regulator [Candidatus Limnocylindria bacterium]